MVRGTHTHKMDASYFYTPDMHDIRDRGYSPIPFYDSSQLHSVLLYFLVFSILSSLSTAVVDAYFAIPWTYLQQLL